MSYGLSYMGNKSAIVDSLALNFPKADNFYDLFGGGGSVTHYMALHKSKNYKNFHYNEINKNVVTLFQKAVNGDYNYDKFKPEWISREKFLSQKDSDAYIALCWSFGNNQKDYLFGDIELYKRSMHQAVVFDEFDKTVVGVLGFDKWPNIVKTIEQKRHFLCQKVRFNLGGETRRLQQLQQLQKLERLEALERLERLQQLEQLQQLEALERLPSLAISSMSYDQIEIKPNSVIYCDIPYLGKREYLTEFNRGKFLDWAAAQQCPVFISEYVLDDKRFKHIYTINKRVLLSNKGEFHKGGKEEKLFWNGVSN